MAAGYPVSVRTPGSADLVNIDVAADMTVADLAAAYRTGAEVVPVWQYVPPVDRPMALRMAPGADGEQSNNKLLPGDTFAVAEEVRGADGIVYLRLADGKGWALDSKPTAFSPRRLCKRLHRSDAVTHQGELLPPAALLADCGVGSEATVSLSLALCPSPLQWSREHCHASVRDHGTFEEGGQMVRSAGCAPPWRAGGWRGVRAALPAVPGVAFRIRRVASPSGFIAGVATAAAAAGNGFAGINASTGTCMVDDDGDVHGGMLDGPGGRIGATAVGRAVTIHVAERHGLPGLFEVEITAGSRSIVMGMEGGEPVYPYVLFTGGGSAFRLEEA